MHMCNVHPSLHGVNIPSSISYGFSKTGTPNTVASDLLRQQPAMSRIVDTFCAAYSCPAVESDNKLGV